MIRLALLALALTAACGPGSKGGPTMHNSMTQPEAVPQTSSVVSSEILAREPLSNAAQVKHILIGWKDIGGETRDPRASERTKADAEKAVRTLLAQITAGADFDALMKEHSEDPGSAATGRAYPVSPDAQLVIEFKQLGLRLNRGEVGVVQSDFGFHIMKRVD